MTINHIVIDNPEVIREILAATDAILLDFDGPVCSVFSGVSANHVAEQLRIKLRCHTRTRLPVRIEETQDPFDIFRYSADLNKRTAVYIESALTTYELEAVDYAEPTPSSGDFIREWIATGRKLAIVTNNSPKAVYRYAQIHKIEQLGDVVFGRNSSNPMLLKPSSHALQDALTSLQTDPTRSLFVGDSLTDQLAAAKVAGLRFIGFINKESKLRTFANIPVAALVRNFETFRKALP